jgi:ATP/maltotriose-dependent transcriptional regulator MalT
MTPAREAIGASIPCLRYDETMREQAPQGAITEVEAGPAAPRVISRGLTPNLEEFFAQAHDSLDGDTAELAHSLAEMYARMEALTGEIRALQGMAVRLIEKRKNTAAAQRPASPALRRCAEAGISTREKEVLAQLLGGMSNREISRALGISEKTVKNHLWRIYRKIGVRNRTQLFHRLICS